jgi:hypothetical protein
MNNLLSSLTRIAILALLLPAGLLTAQNPDSAAINSLLQEVKTHVALADEDAGTMTSFLNSKLHWSSHSGRLQQMKEHINDLIRNSNQMIALRAEGSPWQQQAIDRISSLLPEMAAQLTATIHHLGDNQNRLQMPPYKELVRNNETVIHTAREIISGYVDYGEAKSKSEALEKQLQMPAGDTAGI